MYYVVGQIRNRGGDAIALVFRFDPEARKAEYVTYDNVGEGTWTGYELIPQFEAKESPHQPEFQRDGGENVQKWSIWVKRKTSETEVPEVLVGANGLEPLTPCTSSRCSSQLS